MKYNIATLCFILLSLFVCVFFSGSCSADSLNNRLDYSSRDFRTEAVGRIDDLAIHAHIESTPSSHDGSTVFYVRFTAPRSLEGVEAVLGADGDGRLSFEGCEVNSKAAASLAAAFLPLRYKGEASTVQKDGAGGYIITVCDENCALSYSFSADSDHPTRIFGTFLGRKVDYELKNFVFYQKTEHKQGK